MVRSTGIPPEPSPSRRNMTGTEQPPRDAREEFEAMVRNSGFPRQTARRMVAQAIVDGTFAPILIFPEELVTIARKELGW